MKLKTLSEQQETLPGQGEIFFDNPHLDQFQDLINKSISSYVKRGMDNAEARETVKEDIRLLLQSF